jgi:hypothetical protein
MKRKTNFDRYLEDKLTDKDFAARFKKVGEVWDTVLKMAFPKKEFANLSSPLKSRKIS